MVQNENKILLHACCAICSGYPITLLKEMGYSVVVYFCNPNLDTEEEFLRRLKTDYVWREDNQVDNLAYLGRNLCYFSRNVKDALNDLVFKYYSDVCNGKGKNAPKTEYINHCIKYPTLCSLDYSISDGMKFLLDITAFSNKNDDFYVCVLSVVATWDFENAQEKNNLLDYGLERAKHYNNVQFENIINQLKQEIDKLKQTNV